jgi:hypothetical protein
LKNWYKTVLASSLAHDADVHVRFADGILWASLGQTPDLLPLLDSWVKELKDYDYKPTTIETASMHLRTLLYDKKMLLVVDDVWSPEHAEPFRVGGAGCQILVTTREAKLSGASRYELDVMTEAEALDLLARSLPEPLNRAEQAQALALAKEVGYLPLALQLAAGQIEDGVSWSDLLHDLRAEVARLETLDARNATAVDETQRRKYSLLASFNLSLRQLTPDQLQQFAWLGVLPEDVLLTQPMTAILWEVTLRQAGAILRTMKSKALLLSGPKQGEQQTFRLHDLMHDCAQRLLTSSLATEREEDLPGLGLTCTTAHAALLEKYRQTTTDGQWYSLPDDGYIYAHLTWHMEQAKQLEALHQLFQAETTEGRNAWYEACDRLGQTAGFVTDVARAWRLAEEHYKDNPSQSIALQYRYALIKASLNSLAANIPGELMAALVAKRRWTPAQGLAYTQQVQDHQGRASALSDLAPHLPEALLPQALEAARAIQSEPSRAQALSALAPHLPVALLSQVLEATRAIQSEPSRASILSALAPHLPEALLSQALEAARAIQFEYHRASALRDLALHLPEVFPEALEAARTIQDEFTHASALSDLAPHLPEALLPQALEAARAIQSDLHRARALSALAPHLPEALIPQALEAARAIQAEYHRASAFSGLIVQLDLSQSLLWIEVLHSLACHPRKAFVADLPKLSTAILALGKEHQTLSLVVQALREVSRQWK